MANYLKSVKVDLESTDHQIILNDVDAKDLGVHKGDIVSISWADQFLFVVVSVTDTIVEPGTVGIYEDVWSIYKIPSDETIGVEVTPRSDSLEYIKKKLLGGKFTESELVAITRDISDRRIREVEIAYFMATFFNPGFDDDEVLWTIKGMANAGDILSFTDIKNNGTLVVDKHSIGGIAAKGVTPILVPIIASFGLVIPNTSTRSITTPAGTTDVLEYIMPVALTNDQLMDTVRKTGACMIWGGALRLSPADDVLIGVEKGLHLQSFQKLLVSIIAKKVSMGVSHILIDIPYGPGTKVENPDDVEVLSDGFKTLFAKVGIKCETFTRHVNAPDGRGIGPALEIRDILWVYERDERRPKYLEDVALQMAGKLLELSGKVPEGSGYLKAREKLESGEAFEKLWEIAQTQGAKERIGSKDIKTGEYSKEILAENEGKISSISNKEIVKVARALGNPHIKEAGIYIEKEVGDLVKKGDRLMTLYASSSERLQTGLEALDLTKFFPLK